MADGSTRRAPRRPRARGTRAGPGASSGREGRARSNDKGPSTRLRERYEARRDEVVDAAAAVFAERGFHATSIDDLVEATGLQRGGLYHYIDGKHALLIQIHERFIEPLLSAAKEIVAQERPADETLRLLARELMHDIAVYTNQVTVFLHEWRVIESDPKWKGIRRSRREFEALIEGVLAAGEDQGVFRISDRRITVLAFLGMINYSYQWYRPRGRAKYDEIADQFCDIFLDGIRAS